METSLRTLSGYPRLIKLQPKQVIIIIINVAVILTTLAAGYAVGPSRRFYSKEDLGQRHEKVFCRVYRFYTDLLKNDDFQISAKTVIKIKIAVFGSKWSRKPSAMHFRHYFR